MPVPSPSTANQQSYDSLGIIEKLRYAFLRLSRHLPWRPLWWLADLLSSRHVRWMIPKQCAPMICYSRQRIGDLVAQRILDPHAAEQILKRCCLNRIVQPLLIARCQQLAKGTVGPRVHVTGLEPVLESAASSRPVVLLGSHFGVGRCFPGWFASHTGLSLLSLEAVDELFRMGERINSLRVREMNGAFQSHLTLDALRHLQNGGIVHMTGDSPVDRRATGHRLQIGPVTRTYPQGPAYLACGSRARIFFYFCRIVGPNEVRMEFHEPLLDDHGDQSHSQDYPSDVQLTRAYAEKLVSMQTQFPCEHHHKEFN